MIPMQKEIIFPFLIIVSTLSLYILEAPSLTTRSNDFVSDHETIFVQKMKNSATPSEPHSPRIRPPASHTL